MTKRIPGITPAWSDYLTCLMLHMLLPLLPLLFESMALGAPPPGTLAITAAMYIVSTGLSSENKAMFGLCTLLGIFFSVLYGQIANQKAGFPVSAVASCCIVLVFSIHAFERYNRHVVDCRSYLDFPRGGRSQ